MRDTSSNKTKKHKRGRFMGSNKDTGDYSPKGILHQRALHSLGNILKKQEHSGLQGKIVPINKMVLL